MTAVVSLAFARRGYAEPLAQVAEVAGADAQAALAEVGDDWLELVLIPDDEIVWVIRDAELVAAQRDEAAARERLR